MTHHHTATAIARPIRGVPSPVQTAARLLSETAQDLCVPLTAIRDAVRLVHDGYLGPVTDEQECCLSESLARCDEMQLVVGDMLQMERLRSGMPQTCRQWIDAAEVCRTVEATLSPVVADRRVALVWDTPPSGALIYADADQLRRLLINLIGNAIRVTPVGGQVLVRAAEITTRGSWRFAVRDRGPGVDLSTLQRSARRGISAGEGEGLGLAISRQLASLHLGLLQATSAPGEGAEFAFEVAAAGPRSVADAWIRWREAIAGATDPQPQRRSRGAAASDAAPRAARVHKAAGSARGASLWLLHDGPPPHYPRTVAAIGVRLGQNVPADAADQLDGVLQEGLRMYELAYRADTRRWLLLWDTELQQATQRAATLQALIAVSNPAGRMTWSRPVRLDLGLRSTRARIHDWFVRDCLGTPGVWMPATADCAAAQTAPLPDLSAVACRRLDEQLRRLTRHLARQRVLLETQAAALRAPEGC